MKVSLENPRQRVKRMRNPPSAIGGGRCRRADNGTNYLQTMGLRRRTAKLHRVLAELFRADLLEPLLELLLVRRLGGQVHGLGLVEHSLQDEDRGIRAQRERDGIAGTRIDDQLVASLFEMKGGEEGVLLQVGD